MPSESKDLITAVGLLQLRRAHERDVDAVHGIMCEASAWLTSIGSTQWSGVPSKAFRDYLPKRLAEHDVYLVQQDEVAIGTLCLQWEDEGIWGARGKDDQAGYVHGLAIRRSIAHRGIGARMLDWAAANVAENGRRFLRLDCARSSERLRRYYEQLGFVDKGPADGGGFETQLFERAVTSD